MIGTGAEKRIPNECHPVFSNEELTEWGREEVVEAKGPMIGQILTWIGRDCCQFETSVTHDKWETSQIHSVQEEHLGRIIIYEFTTWIGDALKIKIRKFPIVQLTNFLWNLMELLFLSFIMLKKKKLQFSLYSNYNIKPNELMNLKWKLTKKYNFHKLY